MSFDLNQLFKTLHEAVDEATDVSRNSVSRWIDQFFDIDDDGKHIPKYTKMILPSFEKGRIVQKEVQIPLYTLANHQSIKLDHFEIDFAINLEEITGEGAIAKLFPLFKSSDNKANIKMVFKGSDPAEGVMKINDALVKTIP
jgi:hypothetical protein